MIMLDANKERIILDIMDAAVSRGVWLNEEELELRKEIEDNLEAWGFAGK